MFYVRVTKKIKVHQMLNKLAVFNCIIFFSLLKFVKIRFQLGAKDLLQLWGQPSIDTIDGITKKECEKARCNLPIPRELSVAAAAAAAAAAAVDTDDIVVSTAASPAFFTRRAGCAYTRASASTRRRCRRANTSDETEANSCGYAIRVW